MKKNLFLVVVLSSNLILAADGDERRQIPALGDQDRLNFYDNLVGVTLPGAVSAEERDTPRDSQLFLGGASAAQNGALIVHGLDRRYLVVGHQNPMLHQDRAIRNPVAAPQTQLAIAQPPVEQVDRLVQVRPSSTWKRFFCCGCCCKKK